MSETKKSYFGKDLTVSFDSDVCSHAGFCVRELGSVFDLKARPWIQPDKATADEVRAQVKRCPSGALQIE